MLQAGSQRVLVFRKNNPFLLLHQSLDQQRDLLQQIIMIAVMQEVEQKQ